MSEGKLSWTDIYNMPIWVRKFFKVQYEKKFKTLNESNNSNVSKPDFLYKKTT